MKHLYDDSMMIDCYVCENCGEENYFSYRNIKPEGKTHKIVYCSGCGVQSNLIK
jgi:Pyruvate/2-oxoacid:ferredoxin oxidoreductase delta subunit